MKVSFILFFSFFSCTIFTQTHFYVANRDGNNVLRYDMNGTFIEEFVTSGSGGLSSPQEVLFHPVNGDLIVTGFNNNNIKRYDGTSGDFLGNFSQGYNLSNPTKMIIGADSLLYVTQWGSTQNKIVRFDLNGNFIDEWSSIDVPEGCGMAWDAAGNLLVTTWSNGQNNGTSGFVRKFDPEGNDLGILINSTILQGPVGIWVDENEDLFVIDWTLGEVKKFNSDGSFIEDFITGMARTEGNDIGPDGKYYHCDWQLNRVNRYNQDGSFDTTLVNQGLNIPNGLSFGPDGIINTLNELEHNSFIRVSPNPAKDHIQINFDFGTSVLDEITLDIFDASGKLFTQQRVHTNIQTIDLDIQHFPTGIYYISVSQQQQFLMKASFLKNN